MDEQPLPLDALDYVRNVWATYFLNYYNSRIVNEYIYIYIYNLLL